MAIGDRTYRFIRWTVGSLRLKSVGNFSVGYTETRKEVSAADADAVLAATNGAFAAQTITTGITNPDVPRALSVTPGGTTGDIQPGDIVITGTNVEGKRITESFHVLDSSSTVINGTKAFKTVTSVAITAMDGTGATFSVGTRDALGVNHRLFPNNTTVKVYSYTDPGEPGGMPDNLTLQAAPTVVADNEEVENNLVTPATAPDGTTSYSIFYVFDHWVLAPVNDDPEYSTSTSTSSTSSSTSSTTTTTSTSSTSTSSTSTSSTSTSLSTSSTSTSFSSTSTSTTTVP